MSEKKIVVPQGMRDAAKSAYWECNTGADPYREFPTYLLEAALRWLSENPIVPTDEQLQAIADEHGHETGYFSDTHLYVTGFQKVMFTPPEPKVPEAVRELLRMDIMTDWVKVHAAILEAYKRGQKAGQ